MSSRPTALIFTYSEHGQANVNLAISYELALVGVNVHIASFALLRDRVARLQELIDRHAPLSSGEPTGSIIFHEFKGIPPYMEIAKRHGLLPADIQHPHGVLGALEAYSKIGFFIFPWSQEEYLSAIARVKEIVATTKPDVVGIDVAFYTAQDACKILNQNFVIISPTGIKETAVSLQPYLAAFWKYPVVSSGFPFPLKWWQIPLNIYLYIRFIIGFIFSAEMKKIQALRRSLGIDNIFGPERYHGVTFICPALTEIDFPFAVIPEDMLLCGPIVMPIDPLKESDPELMKWLDNGPTVLINLGSHVVSDEKLARQMTGAFRILLDHHDKKTGSGKIQVLWKAKADGDIQKVLDEVIGEEIRHGRVRVVAWLDVEPVSILQHPNMVCTVHHGGANSFYEGVWSGVPHIVLPVWFDTYDYAQRAEFLNIGIFGSKTSAPGVRAEEFGRALVRVTGDSEEAVKFRTSAKHLKELCRTKGNGRKLASVAVLKEVGKEPVQITS
ncbi:UDP-Glycosyltransferase/glycogen phosphorylase [Imleria badia]|nr:UDP-Glycosyltransferase/glycogen phosphorylase [Imleria badia]